MTDKNDPAFNGVPGSGSPGLTKREYFAGLAMQGIFSAYANPEITTQAVNLVKHTQQAVQVADALIAELNK